MKKIRMKLIAHLKGIVLLCRPHVIIGFLQRPFLMASNILSLTKWIAGQDKTHILNDFYSSKRVYIKRYQLYKYIVDKLNLGNEPINYLEFGVCTGDSYKWWLANNDNEDSLFYGFDTFEGLPESWGAFAKGDMATNIPVVNDNRAEFIPGLFQEALPAFLNMHNLKDEKRKVVHMDADLFSSTLYVLTSLAPYLRKGDILMFDEFNVPNHEYFAFKVFCESYYIKTKLIGAVNNYYQVAFVIE